MSLDSELRTSLSNQASDMPDPNAIISIFWETHDSARGHRPHSPSFGHPALAMVAVVVVILGLCVGGLYLGRAIQTQGENPAITSPSSPVDTVAVQQQLDDIADRALQSPDASGFAGSSVDVNSRTVTILWTQPIPPDVQKLDGTTGEGITVNVIEAKYSEREVAAAGRKVFAAARNGQFPAPNITGAMSDSAGLRIEVKPDQLAEAQARSSAYRNVAGIPVEIVAGSAEAPMPPEWTR